MFDVAVGSFEGPRYARSKLNSAYFNGNTGLYRDNGLVAFKNANARSLDGIRKGFSKIFGDMGQKITIQTNLKNINFLDLTPNLNNGRFQPYRKLNRSTIPCISIPDPTVLLSIGLLWITVQFVFKGLP